MRTHLAVAAAFAALLALTVATLDAFARASPRPGTVWMLGAAGLRRLPADADARVLDVLGGHVLRVHVRSLKATGQAGGWMLRWPVADLGWPACG